ncbi:MAG: hypothetical protein WC803_11135 [Sphingomonas sp.]|jgi:hypothetical protein
MLSDKSLLALLLAIVARSAATFVPITTIVHLRSIDDPPPPKAVNRAVNGENDRVDPTLSIFFVKKFSTLNFCFKRLESSIFYFRILAASGLRETIL